MDLSIVSSNPFKVKLAKVGDIIPPWGVPLIGLVYVPASNILAFSHLFTMDFSVGCRNKCLINQSWLMLSKKPLISASKIHLFSFVFRNSPGLDLVVLAFKAFLAISRLVDLRRALRAAIANLQSR